MSPINASKFTPSYLKSANDFADNPGQLAAYNSSSNCVVLAGPGSGKTKVLTSKMARILAEDVSEPRGLACITYNNECARELTRRLGDLGIQAGGNIFIGTIHSFCLKNILLPYGSIAGETLPEDFRIVPKREKSSYLAKALEMNDINDPPDRWELQMDNYRRTHIDRTSSEWRESDSQMASIIEDYESILRENGYIDFDDMVLIGYKLIHEQQWIRKLLRARFPVLLIDEYQDLGLPLHSIVSDLIDENIRVFAVGDMDQSIYGFAGARPELLRELSSKEGVETIQFPFNYRSAQNIVDAAEIALGQRRGYEAKGNHYGIINFYECPDGIEAQADFICNTIIPDALRRGEGRKLGDLAVLYVDKNDGDIIARVAEEYAYDFIRIDANAPYSKTPLTRWLEDCAAWCAGGWETGVPRLSSLLRTWQNFNRTTHDVKHRQHLRTKVVKFLWSNRSPEMPLIEWLNNFHSSCIAKCFDREVEMAHEKEAFDSLIKVSSSGERIENYTLATFAGQGGSPTHLNLITLHSAKGLEFDVVVMMGMDQGRIPWQGITEAKQSESRRLFYVGLTRARHEVHMTYSGWHTDNFGRRWSHGPSEFLLEVKDRLQE